MATWDTNWTKGAIFGVIKTLLSTLVALVVILNFFSSIVGGVWLAILGDWGSIGLGLLMSLLMPTAFFVVTLPSTGLGFLLVALIEKRHTVTVTVLGFINMLFTNAVIAFWVVLVFGFFVGRTKDNSIFPYLLWGYGTVMAPLGYMAKKDEPEGTPANTLALIFAQICYLICVVFYLAATSRTPWLLYSLVISGVVFSAIAAVLSWKSMSRSDDSVASEYESEGEML